MLTAGEDKDLEPLLSSITPYVESRDGVGALIRLRRQAKHYQDYEGHLLRRTNGGLKLIPTFQGRQQVLKVMHNCTGHCGMKTTCEFIERDIWWPTMRQDISWFVRSFRECQVCSAKKRPFPIERLPVVKVFDTFSVAFVGPLRRTKKGNKSFIVAVQHLTRWPIAEALQRQTSEVAVNLF